MRNPLRVVNIRKLRILTTLAHTGIVKMGKLPIIRMGLADLCKMGKLPKLHTYLVARDLGVSHVTVGAASGQKREFPENDHPRTHLK